MIDTEHPKKSTCNCPHAEGKKIVCKHKVALFFTVFPKEADRYIAEIEEYEREEEEREQERYDQIVKYVNGLSKEELRIELINALIEAEEEEDDYISLTDMAKHKNAEDTWHGYFPLAEHEFFYQLHGFMGEDEQSRF